MVVIIIVWPNGLYFFVIIVGENSKKLKEKIKKMILTIWHDEDGLKTAQYSDFESFYEVWIKDSTWEDGIYNLVEEKNFKFYKIDCEVFIKPKTIKYEFKEKEE